MPSALTMKLIGGIAIALALAVAVHLVKYWHGQANAARQQVAEICSATRDASNNPKLNCRDTALQVRHLGEAVNALHTSLEHQNAAINAQARTTAEQQRKASQASQDARTRARTPERVSAGLEASARSSERLSAPCEPSKALKEAWR